jgi:hypothetical protein
VGKQVFLEHTVQPAATMAGNMLANYVQVNVMLPVSSFALLSTIQHFKDLIHTIVDIFSHMYIHTNTIVE